MAGYACPFCGRVFAEHCELIPSHNYTPKIQQPGIHVSAYCPGSGQHPRNPESDRRKLWSEEAPAAELGKTVDEIQAAQFRAYTNGIKEGLVLLEPVGQDWDGAFKALGELAYPAEPSFVRLPANPDDLVVDDAKTPTLEDAAKASAWWKTVQDGKPRQCYPPGYHSQDLAGAVLVGEGVPYLNGQTVLHDATVKVGDKVFQAKEFALTVNNELTDEVKGPLATIPLDAIPPGGLPVREVYGGMISAEVARGIMNGTIKTSVTDPEDDDPQPFVRGPAAGSK